MASRDCEKLADISRFGVRADPSLQSFVSCFIAARAVADLSRSAGFQGPLGELPEGTERLSCSFKMLQALVKLFLVGVATAPGDV